MTLSLILQIASPEIVIMAGALILLVVGAFGGDRAAGLVSLLAGVVLVGAAAAAAAAPLGALFHNGFVEDQVAVFSKVAIYLMSTVALLLGHRWLARLKNAKFEYPVLILLAALGMGMMVSAGDLISLYVGVELQSLALYVLCAFRRDDPKASEAGLKYFVLGALSSGLLLYGASLIYGFAGSTRFPDIAHAVSQNPSTGVIFGIVFLICGLAFKVSAAPFHMWTPDVYEGAPTPVVAFVAAAPKLAAMVLFARAMVLGFPDAIAQWRQVIVAIAAISMGVGAFAGLAQKNLKRLLAYSSILNIGYALMALSAGAPGGMQAMLVFMVLYMIDVTGVFACLAALSRDGRPMETFDDVAGLARERPGLALALTAFSFSLMGIPPFSGFWAKFYAFKAALAGGQYAIAVFGLVTSVVAAFYYLRLVRTMWFDPAPGRTDAPAGEARAIGIAAALFSFPVVMPFLAVLDPLAKAAAQGLRRRVSLPGATIPVLKFDQIDSTNTEARRRAEAGETGPLWIMADRQTAGRGRRGRAWETGAGNLAATLLLTLDKPPAEAALISFVTALAVADLASVSAPETLVTLKWPNDVMLDGRKLSGVLIESGRAQDGRLWLAVGVGVNLQTPPEAAERPAAALADHLRLGVSAPPTPDEALARLGAAFQHWLAVWLNQGAAAMLAAWSARAAGLGGPCTARLDGETVHGVAEGLDPDGALRLRLSGGAIRRITAGDVFFPHLQERA